MNDTGRNSPEIHSAVRVDQHKPTAAGTITADYDARPFA